MSVVSRDVVNVSSGHRSSSIPVVVIPRVLFLAKIGVFDGEFISLF
jgi:hypothetical protein